MTETSNRPNVTTEQAPADTARAWLLATRPKTLPAAVAPVIVGVALAIRDDSFQLLPALAALAGALLLQIGVNLANDYFDYERGVDTADRLGPVRVTQSGLLRPEQVRLGMVVTFTLAALAGLYLIAVGGWPILVIGMSSILAALAYSGGPFPLGSHGLGDLFVFIFFGLVAVGGTYYVQARALTAFILLAATPVGLLITDILVVNNLRDIESDARAGKHTLAVLLGDRGTRAEYVLLAAVAYLIPLALWLTDRTSIFILLPWLTLPLIIHQSRLIYAGLSGRPLNNVLATTAQIGLLFSLLFALGLVL